MFLYTQKKKGFTVVELLVSISIIGILSTIIFASFSQAQKRARITKRISDMKQMQVAIEYYYAVNKSYPVTGSWRSECNAWGGYAASNVIPGLVPTYLASMPADPSMNKSGNTSCYLYTSDGVNYAILDHDVTELSTAPYTYATYPELVDPTRDSGANASVVDGAGIWAWKISSPGAIGW